MRGLEYRSAVAKGHETHSVVAARRVPRRKLAERVARTRTPTGLGGPHAGDKRERSLAEAAKE